MASKILLTVMAGTGLFLIFRRIFRRKKPGMCSNKESLEGKTVIVTGANTGIGLAVAKELAKRKAKVIMACRSIEKGRNAVMQMKQDASLSNGSNLIIKQLDLSSFSSIRKFADDILETEQSIHVLINNAGVFGCPLSYTDDGLEMTFGVNHIGHFLLTNLLLDRVIASAPSRIVVVASKLYEKATINFENLNAEKSYKGITAYAQSKLANILFANELHERLPSGNTLDLFMLFLVFC